MVAGSFVMGCPELRSQLSAAACASRLDCWPDRQIRAGVRVGDWNIPVENYKAVNFLRNSARRQAKTSGAIATQKT